MIIVKFSGGLGNQMFQYGIYHALRKRYPQTTVKADISFYHSTSVHQGFELNRVFHLVDQGKLELCTASEYRNVTGEIEPKTWIRKESLEEKVWAWLNARSREKAIRLGTRNVIEEESAHEILTDEIKAERKRKLVDLLNQLDIDKNWYIDGYWQDEAYFAQIFDELKQDFNFPQMTDERDMKVTNHMKKNASVALHVRRGDYANSEYDVLTATYYQNAIECIKRISPEIDIFSYYIFSDDAEYIKANFQWLDNYVIIDWHQGDDSFRDMQIMGMCKYQIIANSSFSTWAGYLNENVSKVVCYPKQYTKDLSNTIKCMSGWISVDC